MSSLRQIIDEHKAGRPAGVYSLCSAHPAVISSACRQAADQCGLVLIEATCNQVNQFGGYTGMRPADFRDFARTLARRSGIDPERVVLGGDHLGPSPWQSEPAERALSKAEQLVEGFVRAGFRKIHLDCSMACADDAAVLDNELVAARAARLCRVAESAWNAVGGPPPDYVIGTEVPTPGGALDGLDSLQVTRVHDARETLAAHERAFAGAGLKEAWSRVIGLVVQPGVEFDHDHVHDYAQNRARELSGFIETVPHVVYEAHSTDYQTADALAALVRDHFAILKVGPGATFALREAYWALAEIEELLVPRSSASCLREVLLTAMRNDPQHWIRHYRDPERETIHLQFSFSDRIRYYWPVPAVQSACATLHANLDRVGIPLSLLSQYLPQVFSAVRENRVENRTHDIVDEAVAHALRPYVAACQLATNLGNND